MGMWRTTSKLERTMLYSSIKKAVHSNLPHNMPFAEKEIITDAIFKANKKYYDIHIMQLQDFISEQ